MIYYSYYNCYYNFEILLSCTVLRYINKYRDEYFKNSVIIGVLNIINDAIIIY